MPAFSVDIDGFTVATVCTDGFDVLNVRASGTKIDDELATLDVSGGSYPEQGESKHLIWANDIPLKFGQEVTVSFLEKGESSHSGKTIEELFSEQELTKITDFKPTTEMFKELQTKPKLRDKFSFRLRSSFGITFDGETKPEEHGFSFSILWNSHQPERAAVSLHSYSLESLETRGPMNYFIKERMQYGSKVYFELVA